MSTDLAREYFCLIGQITKINELVLWPTQIRGVVCYLECSAGYGMAERIDSSEPNVVRDILISKSKGKGGA